jgi:hypothetical protein
MPTLTAPTGRDHPAPLGPAGTVGGSLWSWRCSWPPSRSPPPWSACVPADRVCRRAARNLVGGGGRRGRDHRGADAGGCPDAAGERQRDLHRRAGPAAGRARPAQPGRHGGALAAGLPPFGDRTTLRQLGSPLGAETFANLRWEAWPQGIGLFTLGVLAGERGWLEGLDWRLVRRCGWLAMAGALALVVLAASALAADQPDAVAGGFTWQAPALAVLEGAGAVALSPWVVAWFRRRWDHQGPTGPACRPGLLWGLCSASAGAGGAVAACSAVGRAGAHPSTQRRCPSSAPARRGNSRVRGRR